MDRLDGDPPELILEGNEPHCNCLHSLFCQADFAYYQTPAMGGCMSKPGCDECERRRQAYGDAVFDNLNFDSRLKMAILRDDSESVAELSKRVALAEARRDSALQRFREHEMSHPLVAVAT
jgi:hypothetical protein